MDVKSESVAAGSSVELSVSDNDFGSESGAPTRTAVDKALEVLAAFPPGHTSVGVSELARDLGLTKSTVFRLVAALERNGFVERQGNRYRLGRRLHDLGGQVYEPLPGSLHEVLAPFMAYLYELTRETVHLGVLYDNEVALLGRLHGQRPAPRTLRIGSRFPAHCSALGKAILAHDPTAAEFVLASGLRPRTRDSIVSDRRFRGELEATRERGVAFCVGESRPQLVCVATALLDDVGRPIAALSIGGVAGRFDTRQSAELLRRVAADATRALHRFHRAAPLDAAS
ncbi:IclR family transcriptional regulator [Pseudonocardia sp. H11422]|uniref:IclR family transcriptional regulator n=1 Tax=Pseudonocardia sp. H11422 TaxID=2835866 RepID=UPI001BDC4E3E|nr:IclR family transcriptional regulator [Pseudonocardia sp. H11422]